jgi:O-antigen ligase
LILPFIFLLFSKLSSSSWKPHLSWFVGGALMTALYGNAMILYEQVSIQSSFAMNHVAYRIAFERLTQIHPTYFGMYVCFAIAILWVYGAHFFKHRLWLSIVIQLLLLIALLLLMPKAAILALCLLFVYAMLFLFKTSRSKKIYLSLLLICGLSLFYRAIPVAHQRIDEVFFFAENNSPDVINNSMNMRRLIFQEDLSLLKKNWLLGLGPIQLQEQLNLFFYLSSFYAGQALGSYNTHNEYLNQWLSFGLIGALLFIFVLCKHYRKAFTTKNTLYLFLLIILSVTFFTENVLSRQHGVVFFSLFTSLFFFIPAISQKK